jgi:hypothetical protein
VTFVGVVWQVLWTMVHWKVDGFTVNGVLKVTSVGVVW